jgi:hypothetical protein
MCNEYVTKLTFAPQNSIVDYHVDWSGNYSRNKTLPHVHFIDTCTHWDLERFCKRKGHRTVSLIIDKCCISSAIGWGTGLSGGSRNLLLSIFLHFYVLRMIWIVNWAVQEMKKDIPYFNHLNYLYHWLFKIYLKCVLKQEKNGSKKGIPKGRLQIRWSRPWPWAPHEEDMQLVWWERVEGP